MPRPAGITYGTQVHVPSATGLRHTRTRTFTARTIHPDGRTHGRMQTPAISTRTHKANILLRRHDIRRILRELRNHSRIQVESRRDHIGWRVRKPVGQRYLFVPV
jgi:predicted PP-loop superfamily ATPase